MLTIVLLRDGMLRKGWRQPERWHGMPLGCRCPWVVLVEMVWVLGYSQGVAKPQVLLVLKHLLSNEAFALEAPGRCRRAVDLFAANNTVFSDRVILGGCRDLDIPLYTLREADRVWGGDYRKASVRYW